MLGQVTIPIPPPSPNSLDGAHLSLTLFTLLGTLALVILVAGVYRLTHRGLSYSQAFQFSLVLLGVLSASVMMVASSGVLAAVGIVGGFSLIRFRTPVKDPKDMAYILFVLVVGLSMGAQQYWLAVVTTAIVCAVIIVLTRMNFGLTENHESIIRLTCLAESPLDTDGFEQILGRTAESFHLLSAVGQGSRMELTYGIRPRRNASTLSVLEALRTEPAVEHAEMFDAKHQVEF